MRRTLITQDQFKLEELSDSAQERAHEKYLQADNSYNWDAEFRDVLKWFESNFPVQRIDWSFSDYNVDYGRCELRPLNYDEIEDFTGQRLATWIWNNYGDELYTGKYFSKHTGGTSYKSRHSKITLDEACPTGYCIGYDLLQPIHDFLKKPDGRDLHELMNDCVLACVESAQRDWEDQNTFERFKENCEANEYIFDEEGNML